MQAQPSAATFPGGESLPAMQARAVDAVRRRDAAVEAEHGAGAVWVAVTHGDIVKSILADALGMHLDLFQRIQVDPASVSIVRYTSSRPYVLATNTHAGDLSWMAAKPSKRRAKRADAAVGGGAGPTDLPRGLGRVRQRHGLLRVAPRAPRCVLVSHRDSVPLPSSALRASRGGDARDGRALPDTS